MNNEGDEEKTDFSDQYMVKMSKEEQIWKNVDWLQDPNAEDSPDLIKMAKEKKYYELEDSKQIEDRVCYFGRFKKGYPDNIYKDNKIEFFMRYQGEDGQLVEMTEKGLVNGQEAEENVEVSAKASSSKITGVPEYKTIKIDNTLTQAK